jgi:YesN/AraC family two-component response regulator
MAVLHPVSILLVEDDQTSRDILVNMLALKLPQVSFLTATNGKSGLESFKEHSPALVITDINMPLMDGISMATEIKALDYSAKIIVLTAFSDKAMLESSRAAGIAIDHYVLKPVDYRKLLETIADCLPGVSPAPAPQGRAEKA